MNIAFPLVDIMWSDAAALEGVWTEAADESPVPQMVRTVGFLIADTKDFVVIASSTDGVLVNGRFQIPKGMITSLKPLKPKRKPKVKADGSPPAE